jgi:hypothetical protein
MKLSKAAMRSHHMQLGHMTMMQPTKFADEVNVETQKPRVYSTERYSSSPPSGLPIPRLLLERINRAVTSVSEEPVADVSNNSDLQGAFFGRSWGFL